MITTHTQKWNKTMKTLGTMSKNNGSSLRCELEEVLLYRQLNRPLYRQLDEQLGEQLYRQLDGQLYEQLYWQLGEQLYWQLYRQYSSEFSQETA